MKKGIVRTEDLRNTKKQVIDKGRVESTLSLSLSGRLSITLGPFSPVGKGIIGQRKWEVRYFKLPLFQIRH